MTEAEATEATIHLMYKAYYGEMGGAGAPPEFQAQPVGSGNGQRHRLQASAGPAQAVAEVRRAARGQSPGFPSP